MMPIDLHDLPLNPMAPREVASIGEDASLSEALRRMREHGVHHLVVTDGDAVRGVVADRDILARGFDGEMLRVDSDLFVIDVMTPLIAGRDCVNEHSRLSETIERMRSLKVSALPLVEGDRAIGIVTESDLLALLQRAYEDRDDDTSAGERGKVLMGNPLVQNAMNLLAQAGI